MEHETDRQNSHLELTSVDGGPMVITNVYEKLQRKTHKMKRMYFAEPNIVRKYAEENEMTRTKRLQECRKSRKRYAGKL